VLSTLDLLRKSILIERATKGRSAPLLRSQTLTNLFPRKPYQTVMAMNIASLLNPLCSDRRGCRSSESPTPASLPCPAVSYTSVPKRHKVPKDAAIFSDGNKIVGFINYAAYEAGDDRDLAAQHRRFQINPMGEIMKKGARHIPYNSDKKDFLEKTGRDAFESEFRPLLLLFELTGPQCFSTLTKSLERIRSMSSCGTTMLG